MMTEIDLCYLVAQYLQSCAFFQCILSMHINAFFQQCGQMMLETSDFGLVLSKLWPRKLHFAMCFFTLPMARDLVHTQYIYIYTCYTYVNSSGTGPIATITSCASFHLPKVKDASFPNISTQGGLCIFLFEIFTKYCVCFSPPYAK